MLEGCFFSGLRVARANRQFRKYNYQFRKYRLDVWIVNAELPPKASPRDGVKRPRRTLQKISARRRVK